VNARLVAVSVSGALLLSCAGVVTRRHPGPELPRPQREFRGAWVATIDNIDWPSEPGLPAQEQRAQALAILDRCRDLRLNAVVLQVRPQCDALYPSALEPWSYYLTGRQGQPPFPPYDPLEFWIENAHARGLELHAWFNPYRASHPKHRGGFSPDSMVRRRPDLALELGGEGYFWLDPGHPDTRAHSLAVIMDVVARYDVDGVHLDDYFYPDPVYNDGRDFPDHVTWKRYRSSGGRLSRPDWRRRHVSEFVRELYGRIEEQCPRVKLGISPFGIWRPGHPQGIEAGFDQYDMIYADARLWLREGWVDYFTPQLYWPIGQVEQSFPMLLAWWTRQNVQRRHLWPGIYTWRVQDDGWSAREVADQIMIARAMVPAGPGALHFSMRALMEARSGADGIDLGEALSAGPYRRRALVPSFPWIDSQPPDAPALQVHPHEGGAMISWNPTGEETAFLYVVYAERGGAWECDIVPATQLTYFIEDNEGAEATERMAVSAVDRYGNEGTATVAATGF